MILRLVPGKGVASRLLAALEEPIAGGEGATTLVLGPEDDAGAIEALESLRPGAGDRVLALAWIGTHRDSRVAELRRSWSREEACRASGAPTLALRLAPLLGPESPLWLRLRRPLAVGRAARSLLNPVAETDVIETLRRTLAGRVPWRDWFEVAGREAWTLEELAATARATGPSGAPGAWEPPLEVLAVQRLADPEPWISCFGIEPRSLRDAAAAWAA